MIFTQAAVDQQATDFLANIDAGAAATLVFETSADAVLATVTLAAASFTQSANVLTLAGVPLTATPTANGTIAQVSLFRDAVKLAEFTAATSGAEFTVSSVTADTGIDIDVTGGTITFNLTSA